MTKRLYESSKLTEASRPGVWPIRIITEGKGSSATYTREMLQDPKNHIFANRPMFGNHPKDPNKPWERSPFEIRAKLGSTIEYREVDGVASLWGEAHVSPEVDKWLEEFHDVIGVSIFASGDGYEDENGDYILESFDGDDPYTSVDFVVAPGRGGGVERYAEAYRTALEMNGSAPADTDRKEGEVRMDEATFKALIEAALKPIADEVSELKVAIDNATALVESVRDAQPERVEAVEAAGELATAVAEAKLGEKAVARVLESVKGGKPVADAVAHEKALRDEVLAEAGARLQEGVFGGADDNDHDFHVAGVRLD